MKVSEIEVGDDCQFENSVGTRSWKMLLKTQPPDIKDKDKAKISFHNRGHNNTNQFGNFKQIKPVAILIIPLQS